MQKLEKGLNGSQLKIIALVLMVLDHLHQMFFYTGWFPLWFRWLGRLSAPVFLYMVGEGFAYTSNRQRYLKRLYIAAVLMGIGNLLAMYFFHNTQGVYISNNIFATFFLVVFYLYLLQIIQSKKKWGKLGLYFAFQLIFVSVSLTGFFQHTGLTTVQNLIGVFLLNPLEVEGGLTFILLGMVLYYTRDNKPIQYLCYGAVSLSYLPMATGDLQSYLHILFAGEYYQWMMVFAILLFWMYNQRAGKGHKKLFYIFYPAHIYLFYLVSCFLATRFV